MSDNFSALTGFGFVLFLEDEDDESMDFDAITAAAENIEGISVEVCGDLVIGPSGIFVLLEDTYQETYMTHSDPIKLRTIDPSEIAKLKQFAQDNSIELADDAIGWRVTGYYG